MKENVPVEELRAADVMTWIPLTAATQDSLLDAWQQMSEAGVHHLPVVNANGFLLGVLTAEELAADWSGGPAQQARRHVGDLLRGRAWPRAGPDDSLASVAATMLRGGRDAVPVVERNGVLVGLITARDVVAAVAGLRGMKYRRDQAAPFRLDSVIPRPQMEAD